MVVGGRYSKSDSTYDSNEIRAWNSSLTLSSSTASVKIGGAYTDTLGNYAFLCGGL
jgi:hypothetical protein